MDPFIPHTNAMGELQAYPFSTNLQASNQSLCKQYLLLRLGLETLVIDVIDSTVIPKRTFREAAKALGVLKKGTLNIDEEKETGPLLDFILHNWYTGAHNPMHHFYERCQSGQEQLTDEQMTLVTLLEGSVYRLMIVIKPLSHAGVLVYDVLAQQQLLLMDEALSNQNSTGILLATNTLHLDDYITTTGAAFSMNHIRDKIMTQVTKMTAGKTTYPTFDSLPPALHTKYVTVILKAALREARS